MRSAILPRNVKRRPNSEKSIIAATKVAGLLNCPEVERGFRDTTLSARNNAPERNMSMIRNIAGRSFTPIV